MKTYIGTKIINAEPMTEIDFLIKYKGKDENSLRKIENRHGYLVKYDGGYRSWSPKNVFEGAYRELTDQEKKMIRPQPKKKLGYFKFGKSVLLKIGTDNLLNLFQDLLFVPVEVREESGMMIYEGYSEKFEELEKGEKIPEYIIMLQKINNNIKLSNVNRVDNKQMELPMM